MFPCIKDQILFFLNEDKILNEAEKDVIRKFINDAPNDSTALHGDLQMGNIISTLRKGEPMSSPHDVYFIDLGTMPANYIEQIRQTFGLSNKL